MAAPISTTIDATTAALAKGASELNAGVVGSVFKALSLDGATVTAARVGVTWVSVRVIRPCRDAPKRHVSPRLASVSRRHAPCHTDVGPCHGDLSVRRLACHADVGPCHGDLSVGRHVACHVTRVSR